MSILSNLKAKSKPWEPVPGVVINIQALTVEEGLEEINSLSMIDDPAQMKKTFCVIIAKTLKKSVPESTDEEIIELGLEYFAPLIEVIYEVNNLKNDDVSPEKMEKMMKLRQQMSAIRKR